jgi:hypothetical protein
MKPKPMGTPVSKLNLNNLSTFQIITSVFQPEAPPS